MINTITIPIFSPANSIIQILIIVLESNSFFFSEQEVAIKIEKPITNPFIFTFYFKQFEIHLSVGFPIKIFFWGHGAEEA